MEELKTLYSYMWNDMRRPKMRPPVDDDLLDDIRTELELEEDLIAGTLSFLVGGSMPTNKHQVDNMFNVPKNLKLYKDKIERHKMDPGNKAYTDEVILFIVDLNRISLPVIEAMNVHLHGNNREHFVKP